uniref:Epoxide hydrolase 3 n=1 Tax=Jaculus jaculus TaxID=51337 RepID=A0A8C5K4M7_JACJA
MCGCRCCCGRPSAPSDADAGSARGTAGGGQGKQDGALPGPDPTHLAVDEAMPELVVTALLAPSRASLRLLRALVRGLVVSVYVCVLGSNWRRSSCLCLPSAAFDTCLPCPQSSGLRLHYVSAGRGNGPLMLFLHGFPENWFSWRYQLREFQSRFHVVAVDLRGYGPSDAPTDVDCYTTDLLVADVRDIILGLGYSNCILVSHDWGALIAWNLSIYFPSLVERMVVISGAPMSVYQEYSIHHVGQLFQSNYMFLFQLPWLPEKLLSMSDFQILKSTLSNRKTGIPHLTPSELEAFLYHFSQPGGLRGPINYYRNIFRNFPLEPQELATPTLLLWGEKDPYLQHGLVGAISSRFVPDRLEAHILPAAGHWIPQSHPRELHRYMWTFLRDLLD